MRKISTVLCVLFLALSVATTSYAIDLQKLMHNALGNGYSTAMEGSRIPAKKYFRKAFDLAKKLRDWSVMIDAAGGLLALGDREDALKYFDEVAKLNKNLKDWRASIALGYNYLAFPKGLIDESRAMANAELAKKYASDKKDCRGLIESAKLFDRLKMKESSLECLETAKTIGMESKNDEAMIEIASYYKKSGDVKNSQSAIKLAEQYKSETQKVKPYPPDFKPYGETVAEPRKVPVEAQIAERESTDSEISAKLDYLAKMEEAKRKEKEYYIAYDDYYDYPYYYRYYSIYDNITYLPPDWLGDWARFNLRRYRFLDGNYMFLGW
ncbi:MAG: hypothetical protein KKD29_06200 [Candidatus Omnitrophica bacterium]|nr:hypothetical protein [Candidatus Omnitrophota bacterium]MBU4488387.1 hypothetical protein [Candidatus Omnitrophota bacterium]MCG2705022.1 hypothetical protein [Candidatus Omnitrophota bacterium]